MARRWLTLRYQRQEHPADRLRRAAEGRRRRCPLRLRIFRLLPIRCDSACAQRRALQIHCRERPARRDAAEDRRTSPAAITAGPTTRRAWCPSAEDLALPQFLD